MSQANIQHTTVTTPVPHVFGEMEHVDDDRRYVPQVAGVTFTNGNEPGV